MKKQHRAAISFALALIFALVSLPASALPRFEAKAEITPAWTVPEGYNAHDYTKCVTFLEQTDENGVKNGEKISENYDPNDPETWGLRAEIEDFCFHWTTVNGEQRVREINVELWNLCGRLDVSGCTALEFLKCYNNNLSELDVSGCTNLLWLNCYNNNLTELNASGCTALESVNCYNNNLTKLDVSSNTALEWLNCSHNNLTELDVTGCTALRELDCRNNSLVELDVSNNPLWTLYCGNNNITELHFENRYFEYFECIGNNMTELDLSNLVMTDIDIIKANGNGYIGYKYSCLDGEEDPDVSGQYISAEPCSGAEFEGFYDETGALISMGEWSDWSGAYVYNGYATGTITARFSGGVTPGDIDGNGSVTVADAITALRLAMGLLDGSGLNTDAADMDGNGSITIVDAITILRTAMGLA